MGLVDPGYAFSDSAVRIRARIGRDLAELAGRIAAPGDAHVRGPAGEAGTPAGVALGVDAVPRQLTPSLAPEGTSHSERTSRPARACTPARSLVGGGALRRTPGSRGLAVDATGLGVRLPEAVRSGRLGQGTIRPRTPNV